MRSAQKLRLLRWSDDVLRQADWPVRTMSWQVATLQMLVCLVIASACYGAAMGTFRAFAGQSEWALQMVYSAIKAPLLLTGAFALSLPSCFVLSSLLGLREDFLPSLRALIAAQTGIAIVLASLGPVTLLCYASSANYDLALALNGAMFAIASWTGQRLLFGYYRPLLAKRPRHRTLLRCWGGIYALVAIQLAWLLRPFVGSAGKEVEFLRAEAWDNAYVRVASLVWRLLIGS